MGLDGGTYVSSLQSAVDFRDDVLGSLLKSLIFGVIVGLIATYRGFTSEPTSAGVSRPSPNRGRAFPRQGSRCPHGRSPSR